MSDHRDESLLDRIKSAFGMGDDGTDASPDAVRDDVPTTAASTAATPQAGFSEPFEEDLGDPANRPTGPDYGAGAGDRDFAGDGDADGSADDATAVASGTDESGFGAAAIDVDEFGAGLDDETIEGTAATDTGPRIGAAGYDDPYETVETVAGPGPMGASTSDADDAWTRGEAASGTSPFDPDERAEGAEGDVIEQERRETGI